MISLALLFMTGVAYLIVRRKSTSGAAVLLVFAVASAGWAYGSIVNTPTTCGAVGNQIASLE